MCQDVSPTIGHKSVDIQFIFIKNLILEDTFGVFCGLFQEFVFPVLLKAPL